MAFKESGSNHAVKEEEKKGCPGCTGGFCTFLAALQQVRWVEVVPRHPGLGRCLQLGEECQEMSRKPLQSHGEGGWCLS